MNTNRISLYTLLSALAFFSLINSVPAAAACASGEFSLTFLAPSPSFLAYTVETKTIRARPCGVWWTKDLSVSFSTNEPALALYDDGRHDDGAANDGVYGGIWRPAVAGRPVTLTMTATDPYKPNATATVKTSMAGEVRPRFYGVESVPFQWVDATGGVKQQRPTTWPPRSFIPAIPIGFDFKFYGTRYNSLAISDEGAIVIGRDWVGPYDYTATGFYITSFGPAQPNNVIAPFWDIGLSPTDGTIYTLLDGIAPNRRLTISWNDITYTPNCGDMCFPYGTGSFQATLYEGSNDIVYRYLDVEFGGAAGDPGASYTVGVENSDGTQASTYYSAAQNINPPTPAPLPVTSLSALRFFVSKP